MRNELNYSLKFAWRGWLVIVTSDLRLRAFMGGLALRRAGCLGSLTSGLRAPLIGKVKCAKWSAPNSGTTGLRVGLYILCTYCIYNVFNQVTFGSGAGNTVYGS